MITVDNHVGGVHPTKHGPLKVVKGASAQTSEAFVVPAFGIQLTLSGRRDGIIITYFQCLKGVTITLFFSYKFSKVVTHHFENQDRT